MTDNLIEAIERVSLRKDPEIPVVVIREHLLRYVLAMENIVDKDVLDVACGTGYGMYLMSYLAKSISGYDYNQEAIDEAKKFPFKCDMCLEIRNLEEEKSLSNHKHPKFDVVTCFETIEHVSNPKVLLKNIKDCLNPKAVVYISTPNDIKHTDKNKWHKVHFDFYTLYWVILEVFGENTDVKIFGQDQFGMTNDMTKPYIVAKITL